MSRRRVPAGIEQRTYERSDGTSTRTFSVRFTDPAGNRRRRSFDTLDDALDFQAKHRSARRWRPDELRQEQGGRQSLADFFEQWWLDHALIDLRRTTLTTYRYLWEAHIEQRLGPMPLREIDAPVVVELRNELIRAGVGTHSIVKTLSMMQRVFRDAVEAGEVAFNPFK